MAYGPPKNEMEERIVEILKDALQVDQVGVDDNFFDLGGTSERLAEVQIRLQALVGREIQPVEIFNHPTVATLATYLGGGAEAVASERPIQDRTHELKTGRSRLKQRLRQKRRSSAPR